MGQINVKGLGVVNIAGDEPTPNEIEAIKDKLKEIKFKDMKNILEMHEFLLNELDQVLVQVLELQSLKHLIQKMMLFKK